MTIVLKRRDISAPIIQHTCRNGESILESLHECLLVAWYRQGSPKPHGYGMLDKSWIAFADNKQPLTVPMAQAVIELLRLKVHLIAQNY